MAKEIKFNTEAREALKNGVDQLANAVKEIDERLDGSDGWSEEDLTDFIALSGRFSSLSQCDISGEMSDYRRRNREPPDD